MNILQDKRKLLKFLIDTIDKSNKTTIGLRSIIEKEDTDFKVKALLEVVANQSVQIRNLSIILLVYCQSNNFDTDVAILLNKMDNGQEALQQMFKNKLDGK